MRRSALLTRVLSSLSVLALVALGGGLLGMGPAAASTVRYSHTWSPPLNLASNYRPCCASTAGFTTLPFTMTVSGSQGFNLGVRMRTNWVDTKAVGGTPNIIQQGRFVKSTEIKISIHSGVQPGAHHAQCFLKANGVTINVAGPKNIDVADGNWHYIVCIKFPDTASGTDVRVTVDGVIGPIFHTNARLGSFVFTNDAVDLGGQSAKANKDSIDGQYQYVVFTTA
jgi:hypothetical protein